MEIPELTPQMIRDMEARIEHYKISIRDAYWEGVRDGMNNIDHGLLEFEIIPKLWADSNTLKKLRKLFGEDTNGKD